MQNALLIPDLTLPLHPESQQEQLSPHLQSWHLSVINFLKLSSRLELKNIY